MADEVAGMAERVEARLTELRLTPGGFAEAAGLSRQGLADVRGGIRKKYQRVTIYGVAKALGWRVDWYDRLLDGLEPVEADEAQVEADEVAELRAEVAELRQIVERWGIPPRV